MARNGVTPVHADALLKYELEDFLWLLDSQNRLPRRGLPKLGKQTNHFGRFGHV